MVFVGSDAEATEHDRNDRVFLGRVGLISVDSVLKRNERSAGDQSTATRAGVARTSWRGRICFGVIRRLA